jgi:hypothetical protein
MYNADRLSVQFIMLSSMFIYLYIRILHANLNKFILFYFICNNATMMTLLATTTREL